MLTHNVVRNKEQLQAIPALTCTYLAHYELGSVVIIIIIIIIFVIIVEQLNLTARHH